MKVIFTCGGTAGHVNPALALAGYMRQQDPKARFLFVGTPDGMERDLVEKAGYPFRGIPMGGFQRSLGHGGLGHNLNSLTMLPGPFSVISVPIWWWAPAAMPAIRW